MKFVVTGTGRSGTRWASEVLGVGHQAMFTGEGFVDSKAAGDCSFWAASQNLEGWRVVLLVRDPSYMATSWLNTGEFEQMLGRGYWRLWQHCNRIDPTILNRVSGLPRLAEYWHATNYQMAQRADVVMRLEDCTPEALADACGEVPYRDVSPPESTTTSADLKAEIYPDGGQLAKEFGYDC